MKRYERSEQIDPTVLEKPRVAPDARDSWKVLFLTNSLKVGGVETNLVRLVGEFRLRGHRVIVATGGGSLTARIVATGAVHVKLHMSLDSPARILNDVRTLRRVIGKERPDVIHVFSASAAFLANCALAARTRVCRPRIPLISSIMGLQRSPEEGRFHTLLRAYATCLGASRVIIPAPAIGRVVRRLPVKANRLLDGPIIGIRPLASGRCQEARDAARKELDVKVSDRVVLTIGRLETSKSHELFIQAAAYVASKRDDVQFFVVGGGALQAELFKDIRRLGLETTVHLLGERTDATSLLAGADVYVRPGVVEGGAGVSLLEAQALEVPVVAFETEDVKLAVSHRQTGWLVPIGDVEELGRAVMGLLTDGGLARSLGRAGRLHVESHFSISAVVDAIESVYAEEFENAWPGGDSPASSRTSAAFFSRRPRRRKGRDAGAYTPGRPFDAPS